MGRYMGLCMGLGTVCVDVVFVRVLYDHYLPMVARCVQVRLGFDDTRTLMKEIDSDGSGSINYREFVRFLRGSGDASEASAKAAAAAPPLQWVHPCASPASRCCGTTMLLACCLLLTSLGRSRKVWQRVTWHGMSNHLSMHAHH